MPTTTLNNPPEIAREAIRQLALRRMTPTPDNYARLYDEVSGAKATAPRSHAESPDANAWAAVLREFLRTWDARVTGFTQARKRETLERLLERRSPNAAELHKRLSGLIRSWAGPAGSCSAPVHTAVVSTEPDAIPVAKAARAANPAAQTPVPAGASDQGVDILRELLAATVENAVSARLGYSAAQVAEGAELAAGLRAAQAGHGLSGLGATLRRFWGTLESHGAGQQEVVTGLTLLLQLLLSNLAELTADDRWLKGQLEKLNALVSGPMDTQLLVDAHRGMREVIARQGTLKHSLDEARQALKEMLAGFIDRLGYMSVNTGDFHGKIEGYVTRIEATDDFTHLSGIVRELLTDTRGMQGDIARTHGELQAAQKRADEYETKVRVLETQLVQVSELVCEDALTSALNRRGLGDAFLKESARSERGGEPLCVAVLDLDNFKNLNDRLGHQAGDDALVHLVEVVREVIRPTDVLGRYGGEEFVILLPDTTLEAAQAATMRVQRALTRRFFLHNNERVLITFSAGVAQFQSGDPWERVIERADRALYEAKRAGKNRVVLAPAAGPARTTREADSPAHIA